MFDRRKWQAQLVLKGYTISQLADELGINSATMYRKLGSDGDFSRDEINKMIDLLAIDDVVSIFFAPEVAQTQRAEEG